VQKPLDHARLHVLDPDAPRGAVLHGAEELRPKHPGPRGKHVPVGEEEPVADADRHVGGLQHAREVPVQVRRRSACHGRRVFGAMLHDGDGAPDCEAVRQLF